MQPFVQPSVQSGFDITESGRRQTLEVASKKATHWPLCVGSYVALTGCIAAVIRL